MTRSNNAPSKARVALLFIGSRRWFGSVSSIADAAGEIRPVEIGPHSQMIITDHIQPALEFVTQVVSYTGHSLDEIVGEVQSG